MPPVKSNSPLEALKILTRGRPDLGQDDEYGFSGAIPTQGELSSPFEKAQTAQANAADARDRAQFEATQKQNAEQNAFLSPGATEVRNLRGREKLNELLAVPQQQGANALALEAQTNKHAVEAAATKQQGKQDVLQALTGGRGAAGGGMGGPGSSIKPAVNAAGDVSYTVTQMPALVQRARNQLMDARDKTITALSEAERMYPGINDESTNADVDTSGSAVGRLMSGLTGIGAKKYGGPSDRAKAGIERANYTLGIPTPFSELAQTASFGNIEQMAGQLPGVRGLATISPMFKEHQSRWGHETPLATVQRLRHMSKLMDETLHTLDTSGAAEPEPRE